MIKFPIALFISTLAVSNAANALDRARPEVRAFIEETAAQFDLDKNALGELLAQAETKQAILEAISRPAERVVPWHEYRERAFDRAPHSTRRRLLGRQYGGARIGTRPRHRRDDLGHPRCRNFIRAHHRPLSRPRRARDARVRLPALRPLLSR